MEGHMARVILPYMKYLNANWRAQKKHDLAVMPPLRRAYSNGVYEGKWSRHYPKHNPYPLGKRHDEWERGYDQQKA
jgi:hypothetical protein